MHLTRIAHQTQLSGPATAIAGTMRERQRLALHCACPARLPVRAGGSLTNVRAAEGSAHPRNRARPPWRRGRQPAERLAR
eukprot:scaffold100284_cov39-Phaeocystis_antarctica.AAC.1